MRIKLLEPYGFAAAGDYLDPDPPVAQLLIERGIAVAATDAKATDLKAVDSPPKNKVQRVTVRKHRSHRT